jgi:hypothetical protein
MTTTPIRVMRATYTPIHGRYTLNTDNYRAMEFQYQVFDSVWVFGCSFAFGSGVDGHQTFSHHISQQLAQPVVNLAQPGSSIRYQVDQLALLLHQHLRPRAIVVAWPDPARFTWIGSQGRYQTEREDAAWRSHCADAENVRHRAELDMQQFEVMCELLGVPWCELTWSTAVQLIRPMANYPHVDYGTDNHHPGPRSHEQAADVACALLRQHRHNVDK